MTTRTRRRLLGASLVICGVAVVWSTVLLYAGGFTLSLAGYRIFSSRGHRNPMYVAIAFAALSWMLSSREERAGVWQAFEEMLSRRLVPRWIVPALVVASVVWVIVVGSVNGAFAAGGADSYGYVSQAHLWATGAVRIEQPFVHDMHWVDAPDTLAPLGYRVTDDGNGIVPIFPPGLPLTMSIFELVAGRGAVFYVVPLLGGVAIWATYLMGRRLGGQMVGLFGAVLLATSPTFLITLMMPMTDVPVTAWWALSLAFLAAARRWPAFWAGMVAGAGCVTRLNLLPLLIPGLGLLVWQAMRQRAADAREARVRAACYLAGLAPACVAIALINARLYGSPLVTGLGTPRDVYGAANIWANLATYPVWLVQTQTPVVLAALGAPMVLWWRGVERGLQALAWTWLAFAFAVLGLYLLYNAHDEWYWLRYILPAFPALFVLTGATLRALLDRLRAATRTLAMAAAMAWLGWSGLVFAQRQHIYSFRETERKTPFVGEDVRTHMSDRAVFVSQLHSGSLRYYANRLTVRWDVMPPDQLDLAIAELRRLGYHPYVLLEPVEVKLFQERFARHSPLAPLDWSPVTVFNHSTRVTIWDPADRALPRSQQPVPQVVRVE